MPIYSYMKQNGQIVEKLFKINNVPDQIELQNGEKAIKIIDPVMFAHAVHNQKQQDEKKRDQQQRRHMMQYEVQFFNPLKGQSKEQAKKDFQKIKNKLSEQMLEKKQIRKKINKQKRQKNKRTFKQNQRLYFKMQDQRKSRQFQNKKLNI